MAAETLSNLGTPRISLVTKFNIAYIHEKSILIVDFLETVYFGLNLKYYYYYYHKFCSQIEVPEPSNCRLVPY